MSNYSVSYKLYLNNKEFINNLNKAKRSLRNFGSRGADSIRNMGSSVTGMLGGFVSLTSVISSTARTVYRFQDSINNLQATSQASKDEMAKLSSQSKQLGMDTQYSAIQVTEAQIALSQAGFTVQKILGATPGVLSLATSAGISLGESADFASNALSVFGMEASDMNKVADAVAGGLSRSNIQFHTLQESMKYAGSASSLANQSFSQTVGLLGGLGNIGIKGSLAGTALQKSMVMVATENKKTMETFKRLGIETKDSNGNIRKFSEILKDLKTSKAGISEYVDLFGHIAGSKIGGLVQSKDFAMLDSYVMKVEGLADTMAGQRMTGIVGAWKNFLSKKEAIELAIGEAGMTSIFEGILNGASKFFIFLKQNTGVLRVMVKLFSIIAVTIAGLVAIKTIAFLTTPLITMAGVFLKLMHLINLAKVRQIGLNIALRMSNPYFLIITAVGILIGMFVILYKKSEKFRNVIHSILGFFTSILSKIGSLGSAGLGMFKNIFGSKSEATSPSDVAVQNQKEKTNAMNSNVNIGGALTIQTKDGETIEGNILANNNPIGYNVE